ncbi:hypothetical protein QTP88_010597 [Uroleucon formosanum]
MTEQLIELVRKYTFLYDTSSKNYKNVSFLFFYLFHEPKFASSFVDFQLLHIKCTTGNPDNKRLLLVDDADEDNRLVIFVTNEGLQNISKSNEWYMDGNFALSPKGFMQLYYNFNVIHCLITKKTQSTYERMDMPKKKKPKIYAVTKLFGIGKLATISHSIFN